MAQDDELLVVRPAGPHPHVQDALAACVIDLVPKLAVLRGREGQPVPVGAPKETANVDAAPGRLSEHRPDFCARAGGETFVGVASPVSEHQQVAVTHLRDPVIQLGEVRRPMDQRTHQVALGPRPVTLMAAVQPGRGVSAFAGSQEPLCGRHIRSLPQCQLCRSLLAGAESVQGDRTDPDSC